MSYVKNLPPTKKLKKKTKKDQNWTPRRNIDVD